MYTERELKDGTRVYFARPAKPIAPIMVDALAQAVAQVPEIVEAHLPQYFAEGDAQARLVLVIGVRREADIPAIIPKLAEKLRLAISPGESMEILPYEALGIPAAVRATQSQIFTTTNGLN